MAICLKCLLCNVRHCKFYFSKQVNKYDADTVVRGKDKCILEACAPIKKNSCISIEVCNSIHGQVIFEGCTDTCKLKNERRTYTFSHCGRTRSRSGQVATTTIAHDGWCSY